MNRWVDNLLGRMNTDQKIGQLLVFGFCGPVITPDIVEFIKKYNIGGIRLSQGLRILTLNNDFRPGEEPDAMTRKSLVKPYGKNRDFSNRIPTIATAYEYAKVYNELRQYSLDRELGIPIHYTIDQEGNASDDLVSGQRLFPHPMGIVASGDKKLAYEIGIAVGKQARDIGINMIHSLTLDVNINPNNPEIGTRAYSDNMDVVSEYALETLKAYNEMNLIATGKHFPGRGDSESDAHWGMTTIKASKDEMYNIHMAPYKKMIEAGLPAILFSHSAYPSLGIVDKPAGMSKHLIKEILREELKFDGVITTDNMMMGSILKHYEIAEACVEMMVAGCDLILMRDESPVRYRVIDKMKEAVINKRISEKELDEKVKRILEMRYKMGLHINGGLVSLENFSYANESEYVISTANKAARETTMLLRDRENILPVDSNNSVLLIEQVFPTQCQSNNMYSHPGMLWECMSKYSDNINSVEIPMLPDDDDKERILRRVEEADIIVATNYYYHKYESDISDLLREIRGNKQIILVTNTPYKFGVPHDFGTILVTFNPGSMECLNYIAQSVYGRFKPTAHLEINGVSYK